MRDYFKRFRSANFNYDKLLKVELQINKLLRTNQKIKVIMNMQYRFHN